VEGGKIMISNYADWAQGIIVKDPIYIIKLQGPRPDSEQATMCILIDHYQDQKTIPEAEAIRLKELVNSPDLENMELVKVLLQQKYHILR
jgi:hypothetical protein